jgi:hypothetical protein
MATMAIGQMVRPKGLQNSQRFENTHAAANLYCELALASRI